MRTILSATLSAILFFAVAFVACSDDDEGTNSTPQDARYVLDATHCEPLEIIVNANETIELTVTDSVHTHPGGGVVDCDFWTDADGIPGCHYVATEPQIHGLAFMALVGSFETNWFLVGTSFDTTLTATDTLMLKVNDWGPCAGDSDNDGRFVIRVTRN